MVAQFKAPIFQFCHDQGDLIWFYVYWSNCTILAGALTASNPKRWVWFEVIPLTYACLHLSTKVPFETA